MIIMGVIGLIIVMYIGSKFMGDDKPQYYGQQYMQQPQVQQTQQQAVASGAKTFFPISNSNRFFRV
jgi:hypothetical protein